MAKKAKETKEFKKDQRPVNKDTQAFFVIVLIIVVIIAAMIATNLINIF